MTITEKEILRAMPISDDEPLVCRFERMIDGEYETYLTVGPFNYQEMRKTLKALIRMGECHDNQ